ncbi:MAG: hypothetical protein H6842_06305 [Rhodospirillaceae bacterium]|nr:hypothetical protein [Rhodospirillaceae bacterium]
MTLGRVTVTGPADFGVYVNKGYTKPAGTIGSGGVTETPIILPFGRYLFETLDAAGKPDHWAKASVSKRTPDVAVTLVAKPPPGTPRPVKPRPVKPPRAKPTAPTS